MLDLFKRTIHAHEIDIKREPEHAPLIPMRTIIPYFKSRVDDGDAYKLINNDTAAIRCTAYQDFPDKGAIVFLVQYADKNVTPPVFSDLKSGDLRQEPLLEGEGVAISAHVLIRLDPREDGADWYPLFLEDAPGLGRSRLTPFLKSEFKAATHGLFDFQDTTDGNKKKKYNPSTVIMACPNIRLGEDLAVANDIQEIELIKNVRGNVGFDEEQFFELEKETVVLKLTRDGKLADIKAAIKSARTKALEDGYDGIRIKYKSQSNRRIKSTVMGTSTEDILDSLICKAHEITASEVLPQCSDQIIHSIASQMVNLATE